MLAGGRGDRLREQHLRLSREGDQVECVARIESVDCQLHGFFGFLDREAAHRARGVDHEHQLLRRDVLDGEALGRLQNHGEEATLVGLMREDGVFDLCPGDLVAQDEVLIWKHRLLLERRYRAALRGAVESDLVGLGDKAVDRHAGIDGNLNGDIVPRARALGRDRRRDARGVGGLIGIRGPAAAPACR